MLKVRDIMTADVYTVDADASAEEAAWGLTRRHIGAAPVHDRHGALVGVLSKGDLVNPEPSQWIKGEATVADLMNPDVLAVQADDPALWAAVGMVQRNVHRVIVMDQNLRLAGIVTAFDIVKAVAAGLEFGVPPQEIVTLASQGLLEEPREAARSEDGEDEDTDVDRHVAAHLSALGSKR